MQSETNNLSGFSIQNDYASVTTTGYKAIQYTYDTTNEEYLSVLNENLSINDSTKYLLVFFGTDIIAGDYGSNKKITKEIIPEIVSTIETKAPNNAHILYIQAGGAATDNITTLISSLRTL
jgi:polyphosphate kinase 2 (PPK2 family)